MRIGVISMFWILGMREDCCLLWGGSWPGWSFLGRSEASLLVGSLMICTFRGKLNPQSKENKIMA